jgi:glycosyltransferase involved in cell wall biosynthesis
VITISKYTASKIERRLAVSPERITICPPGAPAWPPLQRYASDGHVLFMGTIEPRKNVETLLRAFALLAQRLPNAPPLVLAGKVTPACEHLLKDLEAPALSGRVKAVGYVSGSEREQLYRDASMLVLPSLDEGFGMPALEAMTIGLPVVASDRGALPEVVGDAGILVDPADAGALASAMERYLTQPEIAARARDAGQQRARRFTWQASAASLARAYNGALDRRRARR